MRDLYDRNLNHWRKKLKKISEDGKISYAHGSMGLTVKITILPKAIYRFSAIPIKIPTYLFIDLEKILNFIYERTQDS